MNRHVIDCQAGKPADILLEKLNLVVEVRQWLRKIIPLHQLVGQTKVAKPLIDANGIVRGNRFVLPLGSSLHKRYVNPRCATTHSR